MRLFAIVIGADDPGRLSAFYEKVFGMSKKDPCRECNDPEGSIRLKMQGFSSSAPDILFVPAAKDANRVPADAQTKGYAHICFEVSNVSAAVNALVSNGGTMLSSFEDHSGELTLYLLDPEKNIVEIHVPLPEPFKLSVAARTFTAVLRAKTGIGRDKKSFASRFLHVNIVSPDWNACSGFYADAFDGEQTGKLRDYAGDYIRTLTGMSHDIHVEGKHISLPCNGKDTITTEIFTYTPYEEREPLRMGDKGIISMDFATDDPEAAASKVEAAGGKILSTGDGVTYTCDPDGNLLRFVYGQTE